MIFRKRNGSPRGFSDSSEIDQDCSCIMILGSYFRYCEVGVIVRILPAPVRYCKGTGLSYAKCN